MSKQTVARANGTALIMLACLLILVAAVMSALTFFGDQARGWVQHTHHVIELMQELDTAVSEAETGQRGFLLTNQETYLQPYQVAVGRATQVYEELVRQNSKDSGQGVQLARLAPLLRRKFEELADTIRLRRDEGFDAALAVVRSDLGLRLMDHIRATLDVMRADEQQQLRQRLSAAATRDAWVRIAAMAITAIATFVVIAAEMVLKRSWTRHYEAEKQQRVLVSQLRATLDSLDEGVAVFDADRRLINWNSGIQHLLGLPRAMIRIGTPYDAFLEHTTDDTGPMRDEGDMLYERARLDGTVLRLRRVSMPCRGFVLTVSELTRPVRANAAPDNAGTRTPEPRTSLPLC